MIGNYKLQPNYGLDADSHKSPTATISSTTSTNSTMMNHHFNEYQENETASVNYEPDRSIIANIHNYSQPISKQHHHRVIKHEYSSENDEDDDEENAEEGDDEEIIVEQEEKQLMKPNINNTTINQELDDNTPEHHTRRPMNAFLMFCKRHRSIVREKFPNLENRAITKILGDWWANIDEGEKVAYTNLAKEYKDAFFSAHPNFKWYKLPAPPLRTLSTRPGPFSRTSTSISEDDHDYGEPHNYKGIDVKNELYEQTEEYEEDEEADNADYNETQIKSDNDECTKLINNNLNSIERNLSLNDISIQNVNNNESENSGNKEKILIDCKKIAPLTNVTPVTLFKLADIQQMGGLNSLMETDHQNKSRDGNSRGNNSAASQNEMGDSNEALTKYSEPFTNMRDHAIKMQEDSIISKTNISNNLKRKMNSATTSSSTSPPYNINAIIYESIDSPAKQKKNLALLLNNNNNDLTVNNNNNNHSIGKETIKVESVGKKSPRACKGQRYKEFMINSGKFPNSPNNHLNHINLSGHHKKGANKINKIGMNDASSAMSIRACGTLPQFHDGLYGDGVCDANSMANKHFATEEFDLEKRIKALPSLNLDSFMVRKRETKKKKKLSKRGKSSKSQQSKSTINETQERVTFFHNKVGSQKRKARKESITRLDVLIKNENHSNDQPFNTSSHINSPVGGLSSYNNNNNNNKDNIDITIDPIVVVNQPSSTAPSNLFILATLAEEEANKTKMQIT